MDGLHIHTRIADGSVQLVTAQARRAFTIGGITRRTASACIISVKQNVASQTDCAGLSKGGEGAGIARHAFCVGVVELVTVAARVARSTRGVA